MKNLKTILLSVFGMMAIAISFTSCNTDSTDYSIDYQTQKQYQSTMANMYSGKMRVYYADAQKQQYVKYDSVQTRWTVRTDSTLTVSDFPVSVLDSCINLNTPYAGSNNQEVQKLRSLKEAIGKLDKKIDLKCYYYVPTTSFVTSSAISFFVNPIYFKQTLEYDGASTMSTSCSLPTTSEATTTTRHAPSSLTCTSTRLRLTRLLLTSTIRCQK